jgi:hypothetical protein
MKVNKAYEITDAKIDFVSLVDKPANKRPFLITKAEKGNAELSLYCRLLKAEEVIGDIPEIQSHFVTGIVYEPMTEDAHGNFMTAEEVAKAAHYFMARYGEVDIQHSFRWTNGVKAVESWIAPVDLELNGEAIKKGTWLATVEITDPTVWGKVLNGEITGFSMGGTGTYSEEDETIEDVTDDALEKSFFKKLAKFIGIKKEENEVTKDDVKAMIDEAVKALQPAEPKADEVTADDVKTMIEEAVKNIQKAATPPAPEPQGEELTAAAIQKMIETAVHTQLDPILKSHGLPTTDTPRVVEKSDNIWEGILL